MARDTEATSLVPWLSTGNNNIFLQEQIYDQLVMQLPGFTDPQPGSRGDVGRFRRQPDLYLPPA